MGAVRSLAKSLDATLRRPRTLLRQLIETGVIREATDPAFSHAVIFA